MCFLYQCVIISELRFEIYKQSAKYVGFLSYTTAFAKAIEHTVVKKRLQNPVLRNLGF